jgi:hypothetical protein
MEGDYSQDPNVRLRMKAKRDLQDNMEKWKQMFPDKEEDDADQKRVIDRDTLTLKIAETEEALAFWRRYKRHLIYNPNFFKTIDEQSASRKISALQSALRVFLDDMSELERRDKIDKLR